MCTPHSFSGEPQASSPLNANSNQEPKMLTRFLLVAIVTLMGLAPVRAEDKPLYPRTRDVIYGKKFGMALTFDVFQPKENRNGAAVIAVISGGYFSRPESINPTLFTEVLKRGYTVFAVLHGSQPKYTIPEIVTDMNRAVRFIRYHAKDYQVDPDRFGVSGGSAGGHLSLMLGTAADKGDPMASDPLDRVSSGVQAVACFFPPTDFSNFGEMGQYHYGDRVGLPFRAAFDYHEFDKATGRYLRITDEKKMQEISRQISPALRVTHDSAPTLIIHGDKDRLVPIQQSHLIMAKFKEAGVPAKLIVKEGADHGWLGMDKDVTNFADWFDTYLAKEKPNSKLQADK
jgi:acetyl esterase/lipase